MKQEKTIEQEFEADDPPEYIEAMKIIQKLRKMSVF